MKNAFYLSRRHISYTRYSIRSTCCLGVYRTLSLFTFHLKWIGDCSLSPLRNYHRPFFTRGWKIEFSKNREESEITRRRGSCNIHMTSHPSLRGGAPLPRPGGGTLHLSGSDISSGCLDLITRNKSPKGMTLRLLSGSTEPEKAARMK